MEKNSQHGFTLIELVVAVSIAAILLGVGVPAFAEMLKNSRTSACYNDLVQSLYLARSEAVKSATPITVCARSTDSQCGSDWNNGWIVFEDNVVDPAEATAAIDAGDEVLQLQSDGQCKNDLSGIGSNNNSASSAISRNYLRYETRGTSNWGSGSFLVCDDRGAKYSRSINIVGTGDIRRGRKANGGEIPLDVFGREISCP